MNIFESIKNNLKESSEEAKAKRKPLKLNDATEQAYMNYVKEWFDERDFSWKDELSYWSGKSDNWDMSDYKKLFDGLYDENGINGELFVSYDEWLNNEYMEESEEPLKESYDEVNYVINNGDYVLSTIIKPIGGEADLLAKSKNGKGTSSIIEGYDQIGGFEFTEEDEPFYSDGVFSTEDIEDLFHKFEPNIKINSLKRMGYDEEELEESEKPLKEASQVTACRNAIEKAKQKLKRSKFGENFGQDEVRKLKDKFDDLSYSEENKQIKDMINDFDDWCANYVPMRESEKSFDANEPNDMDTVRKYIEDCKDHPTWGSILVDTFSDDFPGDPLEPDDLGKVVYDLRVYPTENGYSADFERYEVIEADPEEGYENNLKYESYGGADADGFDINMSDEEVQAFGNKFVNGSLTESQTQEIDAVLRELRKKNPNIDKYLNEYYKAIEDTEPRPAYDKERDRMDPAWENWNKTTNNVLYSREAWDNFTKWVKEKYNENLNESEKGKPDKNFKCEWCGTVFGAMPKEDGTMPNCPHCYKDRYKDDPDRDISGHANKDVHFIDEIAILDEDEYNGIDHFLMDSKLQDAGMYIVQDPSHTDYFVDYDENTTYNLKDGLQICYEAMVPEYIAEYPRKIQKGIEKAIRKYLGDEKGDEVKSWCSKPKKEAESIKTVCGLEDGKSYWAYVSKHGLGPGTIPEDVEAVCVSELPETAKTLFCVDRQLTPEEMKKYELELFDNSYFNKYPEVVKELMALK